MGIFLNWRFSKSKRFYGMNSSVALWYCNFSHFLASQAASPPVRRVCSGWCPVPVLPPCHSCGFITTCKLSFSRPTCLRTILQYYSSLPTSSEQKVNEIFHDLRSNSTKDLTEIPENSVNHDMDCLLGGERQGGWFCEMKRNPFCRGRSFIYFRNLDFNQTNTNKSRVWLSPN